MEVFITKERFIELLESISKLEGKVSFPLKLDVETFAFQEGTTIKFDYIDEHFHMDDYRMDIKTSNGRKVTIRFYISDKFVSNIIIEKDRKPRFSEDLIEELEGTIFSVISILVMLNEKVLEEKQVEIRENKNRKRYSKPSKEIKKISIRKLDRKKITYKGITESEFNNVERNYTVESWSKRGFYRTYKSGKRVFISPITCKRRKKINENHITKREEIYL